MAVDVEAVAAEVVNLITAAVTPLQTENRTLREKVLALEVRMERLAAIEQRLTSVKDGAPGPAGKDADPEEIVGLVTAKLAAILAVEVDRAVSSLPPAPIGPAGPPGERGAPGRDGVDGAPGRDGENGRDGKDGTDGLHGKDGQNGIGLAGTMIDRDGQLVVTLSDGTLTKLGPVVGRDGADGLHGKDGAPGPAGKDGTLIGGLKLERVDERTFRLLYKDGSPVDGGEFVLNHPVFRDTYESGQTYQKGDLVQRDGSGWIALVDDPPMVPGTGKPEDTGWKLWIKKGAPGERGQKGDPGLNGKDGTDGARVVEFRDTRG